MGNIQLIYSFDYPFFSSSLFSRLLTSAPLITDNALLVLKRYCQDEVNTRFFVGKFELFDIQTRSYLGMNTLRDLIFRRINMREKFLEILLDFTHNENVSVRNNGIRIAKNLHEKEEFKQSIEVKN
jgi:symplekin